MAGQRAYRDFYFYIVIYYYSSPSFLCFVVSSYHIRACRPHFEYIRVLVLQSLGSPCIRGPSVPSTSRKPRRDWCRGIDRPRNIHRKPRGMCRDRDWTGTGYVTPSTSLDPTGRFG